MEEVKALVSSSDVADAIRAAHQREREDQAVLEQALEVLDRLETATAMAIFRDIKKQHTRARDAAKNIRELLDLRSRLKGS
jgi:hypothetical protein